MRQDTMSRATPRVARSAVAGAFFLTGTIFGTWTSRIPAMKAELGLTDGQLALALMALNAGAIIGLQAGGLMVARIGSRLALRLALPAFALGLIGLALAPSMLWLAIALAVSAAVNSVVDVAINANGAVVEHGYGRPVLSGLHGMLTLGGILGAAGGAVAAKLGISIDVHFGLVAIVGAAAGLVLCQWLIDDHHHESRTAAPQPWTGHILVLGALAFCVTLAEGSANDWAAVYLKEELGGTEAAAAAGVALFLAAMTIGRFCGDRLRTTLSTVALFRTAAAVACLGLGISLVLRHPLAGLIGFALFGLGLSITLPVILGVASKRASRDGYAPAGAVARVSTVAYLGSFVGPGLIGAAATLSTLTIALVIPVVTVGIAGIGARVLRLGRSPSE